MLRCGHRNKEHDMTHEQATQAVKRVTEFTLDFLAKKHGVTTEAIAAGLIAKDANLLAQWNQCFALARNQIK